jgi:hypothetical protein
MRPILVVQHQAHYKYVVASGLGSFKAKENAVDCIISIMKFLEKFIKVKFFRRHIDDGLKGLEHRI